MDVCDLLMCKNGLCVGRNKRLMTINKNFNNEHRHSYTYECIIRHKYSICKAVFYSCDICKNDGKPIGLLIKPITH